jgi:hypothetical protein
VGLPGQAQGISRRRRYTHTDVALNSATRSVPSAARMANPAARGIIQSCVGALENGSDAPTEAPYWGSGAPFLGVLIWLETTDRSGSDSFNRLGRSRKFVYCAILA